MNNKAIQNYVLAFLLSFVLTIGFIWLSARILPMIGISFGYYKETVAILFVGFMFSVRSII
jgi:hypothetical protein